MAALQGRPVVILVIEADVALPVQHSLHVHVFPSAAWRAAVRWWSPASPWQQPHSGAAPGRAVGRLGGRWGAGCFSPWRRELLGLPGLVLVVVAVVMDGWRGHPV